MKYNIDEYKMALAQLREQGTFPKENYWFYVSDTTGDIKFKSREKKEDGWTGYFVEDDGRMPSVILVAEKRLKRR